MTFCDCLFTLLELHSYKQFHSLSLYYPNVLGNLKFIGINMILTFDLILLPSLSKQTAFDSIRSKLKLTGEIAVFPLKFQGAIFN